MMRGGCRKLAVAAIAALMAGCGGGGSTASTVTGVVADGYLVNAVVFMDKNGNYQWDAGEPKTTTGPGGVYSLPVAPQDVGKYPIVAMAMAGQTVDEDTGMPVTAGYVMSAPPQMPQVVTPFSSLVREKLAFGGYTSMQKAMAEVKAQLNMPSVDVMADYMKLGRTDAKYAQMHRVAQAMAAIMAKNLGAGMSVNGYHYVMGQINTDLPDITQDVLVTGMGMTQMLAKYDWLSSMPRNGGFGNYTSGFMNYSSMYRNNGGTFWNYSGGTWVPGGGPMMGGGGGMMR